MKQLTLQQLIDFLKVQDLERVVPEGFSGGIAYGGDSTQLAFQPCQQVSVGVMYNTAASAVGLRICGKYRRPVIVTEETLVNISDWNNHLGQVDAITFERLNKMFGLNN